MKSVAILVMLAVNLDSVLMQSVSWELITDNPKCKTEVELRCTISNVAPCCSTYSRLWKKSSGGTSTDIVADGASSDPSKYIETLDTGNSQTTLTIKNFDKVADVNGVTYTCEYGGYTDSKALQLTGDDKCTASDCGICAGKCYGYGVLGIFSCGILFVIGFGVYLCVSKKELDLKKKLKFLVLSILISLVIYIPIAVPIGLIICHCNDGIHPAIHIVGGIVTEACVEVIMLLSDYYCCNQRGVPSESNGSCWPPCRIEDESSTTETNNTNRSGKEAHTLDPPKKKRPLPPLDDKSPVSTEITPRPLPKLPPINKN